MERDIFVETIVEKIGKWWNKMENFFLPLWQLRETSYRNHGHIHRELYIQA